MNRKLCKTHKQTFKSLQHDRTHYQKKYMKSVSSNTKKLELISGETKPPTFCPLQLFSVCGEEEEGEEANSTVCHNRHIV